MKSRGEDRVWNVIRSKSGSQKKVTQTQIGQQLIFSDALNILGQIREWIESKSPMENRKELKTYFKDDEILLLKIVEIFLLLASRTLVERGVKPGEVQVRHRSIVLIRKKVFKNMSFDLVWRIVEVVVEASEYFSVNREITLKRSKMMVNLKYVCSLSESITQKLTLEASGAFFPEPMTEPPEDWRLEWGRIRGGYKTFQYDMIRSNSFDIKYKNFSQKIFDAVNYIQSTPWRVNKEMVDIVKTDLKAPVKTDFVKTEFPNDEGTRFDVDLKGENLNLSKNELEEITEKRKVYLEILEDYTAESREFESAMGKHRAVVLAVGVADRYADAGDIYFPHSYDFRGRVYPLSAMLTPQGSDAVKAMLEYSSGEALNKSGEKWAWAYLTSLYGDDKIDFEERVKKGKQLLHTAYTEADEPYQFLAHQLELRKFVENPDYEFKGRIHLDACNSGSQFTSALTGDVAGCMATNVIPTINKDGSQSRQDAYLLVSNKALELTKSKIGKNTPKEEKSGLECFKRLLEENGRKICKKPVMVSNYGGTEGGRTEIIKDMLRELKVERKFAAKNAAMYSKILGNSITGVLNGGKAFESYIQQMNGIVTRKNKPITWTTSDGFHVTHVKNKELKPKQVRCLLPGARRATVITKKIFSDDVSPSKMKSAISPNYIHSLDAELLRRVAIKMRNDGMVYTDWIHDSFGCHPNNVDFMLHVTKSEFKKLVQRRPLKTLDAELRKQAGRTKPVLKKLDEIKLPENEDFDYDLPLLGGSNWFFS